MTYDVAPFQAVDRALIRLTEQGWNVQDAVNDVRLMRTVNDLATALSELLPLSNLTSNVDAVGEIGGYKLRLTVTSGEMEVVSLPEVDPHDLFDEERDLENALRAWERDAAAAQRLPMTWHIVAFLSFNSLVPRDANWDLRIAVEIETILAKFRSASTLTLSRLVSQQGRRRVYLSLRGAATACHLGAISLVTLGGADQLVIPEVIPRLPGEGILASDEHPVVGPRSLLPIEADGQPSPEWRPVVTRCEAAAAALIWIELASTAVLSEDRTTVEFLGFKRVNLVLPELASFQPREVVETFGLHAWVFQEASPDRLLAVRQVVSLYDSNDAFGNAGDIQASAETIYIGLRSDAVAEVVKSSREAYGQANDSVRQAMKSSQDLIKGTIERFLAGLIATGAVIVADASKDLPDHVTRVLLLLIAGFFGILAIVSILVEGPILSLQVKHLASDLHDGVPLLTERQRDAVVNGASIRATRFRIKIIRVVIPSIYIVLTLSVLRWGYPAYFH
ncbi:MAG TPA: hypothetical protein VFX16_12805 [Pseudonocardiaceae bacterium]|nr:hypothetical protein [Pseudonocardiaceae bacterium]